MSYNDNNLQPSSMNVAIEESRSHSRNKQRKKAFTLWLIGLLVALMPLATPHISEFATSSAKDVFINMLNDAEILFVCVSMLVSASCEIASQSKKREILNGILILSIVAFALLYGEFQTVIQTSNTVAFFSYVNGVSLLVTLILGFTAYLCRRR